jgi:hypothetical protein
MGRACYRFARRPAIFHKGGHRIVLFLFRTPIRIDLTGSEYPQNRKTQTCMGISRPRFSFYRPPIWHRVSDAFRTGTGSCDRSPRRLAFFIAALELFYSSRYRIPQKIRCCSFGHWHIVVCSLFLCCDCGYQRIVPLKEANLQVPMTSSHKNTDSANSSA